MNKVKKFSPRKNSLIGIHDYGAFIEYLNEMSANGFHITDIGRFTNTFDKDTSERYIYSVCRDDARGFYADSEVWEYTAYKGSICFYRKKIPCDAISVRASFVDIYEEEEWLEDLSEDGCLLCGISLGEYFFTKSSVLPDGEYVIERIGHRGDIGLLLSQICVNGTRFLCASPSGLYYFFTPDEQRVSRKKNLRQSIKHSSAATLLALTFIALSVIVGAVLILPDLVSGHFRTVVFRSCATAVGLGALTVLALFIRSKHLKRKYRRVLEAQNEQFSELYGISHKSEEPSDSPNSGIQNNGKAAEPSDAFIVDDFVISEDSAMSEQPESETNIEEIHREEAENDGNTGNNGAEDSDTHRPRFASKFKVIFSLGVLLTALIYCVLWFNRLLPGIFASVPVGIIGFIVSICIILAFPFSFYSHLGK